MKLHASVIFFAVAAIGSLAACGDVVDADGKRNGTANAGNTAVGNAAAQPIVEQISGPAAPLGISMCQWGFRCGEISERTYFDSADACAGFMSAHFDTLALAPGSGMTPTAIAACAAALDASGCGVAWSELPACKFKGTLSNGEACFGDASCASGDCMHTSDATSCGTCVDPGGVGASCDQNSCADGLACDTAGKTTCVTPPKRGESGCVTKGCASNEDRCTANTCVAPLAEGAVCTDPGPGDTDPCIRGTQCAGGVCTALVFAKPGEACSDRGFCAGGDCGADGKCVAKLALGAACDPNDDHCGNSSICDAGTSKCIAPVFSTPSCNFQ